MAEESIKDTVIPKPKGPKRAMRRHPKVLRAIERLEEQRRQQDNMMLAMTDSEVRKSITDVRKSGLSGKMVADIPKILDRRSPEYEIYREDTARTWAEIQQKAQAQIMEKLPRATAHEAKGIANAAGEWLARLRGEALPDAPGVSGSVTVPVLAQALREVLNLGPMVKLMDQARKAGLLTKPVIEIESRQDEKPAGN